MDYKYIEQLLERYFDCQTTLQEEQILRSFFCQEEIPVCLLQYRDLFIYMDEAKNEQLDEEFDEKMIALAENELENKSAKIVSFKPNFTPLFRAAAVVAIILTIGSAAEKAISTQTGTMDSQSIVVDPYIKGEDITSALKIKDVTQAETKPQTDSSFITIPIDEEKAQ